MDLELDFMRRCLQLIHENKGKNDGNLEKDEGANQSGEINKSRWENQSLQWFGHMKE